LNLVFGDINFNEIGTEDKKFKIRRKIYSPERFVRLQFLKRTNFNLQVTICRVNFLVGPASIGSREFLLV